tara:strand:- start:649 stop:978 length:330 start_codon:yes stop_codon:yes gene_type:complete
MKILEHVSRETIPSKSSLNDMFVELIKEHKDKKTIDFQYFEILALKMLLRETCRQDGLLNKYPFNLTAKESYDSFGLQIAENINNTIDNVNHFANLDRLLKICEETENK